MMATDVSDFVTLAARRIHRDLALLLQPHKTALLAIEKQSDELMKEKITALAFSDKKVKAAEIILKATWQVSSDLAYGHAVKEFKLLGVTPIPDKPKLDQSFNKKLMEDLTPTLNDTMLPAEQRAQRAGLAAVSSANRAYTEMQLAMYAAIENDYEIQKVWVTNQNAATPPCKFCMRLHNQAVAIDKPFPVPRGLGVYYDLQGPGAHPNCRCRLTVRVLKKKG